MHRLRPLLLLPLVLSLAGCFGSAPPVLKEQYFRLMGAQPAEEASRQISGGIEIVPFAGEGGDVGAAFAAQRRWPPKIRSR